MFANVHENQIKQLNVYDMSQHIITDQIIFFLLGPVSLGFAHCSNIDIQVL